MYLNLKIKYFTCRFRIQLKCIIPNTIYKIKNILLKLFVLLITQISLECTYYLIRGSIRPKDVLHIFKYNTVHCTNFSLYYKLFNPIRNRHTFNISLPNCNTLAQIQYNLRRKTKMSKGQEFSGNLYRKVNDSQHKPQLSAN